MFVSGLLVGFFEVVDWKDEVMLVNVICKVNVFGVLVIIVKGVMVVLLNKV